MNESTIKIPDILRACQSNKGKLNSWERDFINCVSMQYCKKGKISENQVKKLENILAKVSKAA